MCPSTRHPTIATSQHRRVPPRLLAEGPCSEPRPPRWEVPDHAHERAAVFVTAACPGPHCLASTPENVDLDVAASSRLWLCVKALSLLEAQHTPPAACQGSREEGTALSQPQRGRAWRQRVFTASLLYPASQTPPPPLQGAGFAFHTAAVPPGRPIALCSGTLPGTRDHPTPGAVTARAAASQPRRAAALGSWRSALVTPRGRGGRSTGGGRGHSSGGPGAARCRRAGQELLDGYRETSEDGLTCRI